MTPRPPAAVIDRAARVVSESLRLPGVAPDAAALAAADAVEALLAFPDLMRALAAPFVTQHVFAEVQSLRAQLRDQRLAYDELREDYRDLHEEKLRYLQVWRQGYQETVRAAQQKVARLSANREP